MSIKAVAYKLAVGTPMEDNRGELKTIQEIFIPSHRVIINSIGGLLKAENHRYVCNLSFGVPEEKVL